MKTILSIVICILLSLFVKAQSPQRRNVYMDSVGSIHIATNLIPQVALTGNYTDLLNKPSTTTSITAGNGIAITGSGTSGSPYVVSLVQPTFNFPTRMVNTNFTPNTTKASLVFYSLLCSVSNPLLAGSSSATVTLQYSTNAGSTWQDISQIGNLSSVALAVTIQLTNGQTANLVGIVPANALVRLNSVTAGTVTVSVTKSTEITY